MVLLLVEKYDPLYLDDPKFRQGKHRHVMFGDTSSGPVVTSIIAYVKPKELKEVGSTEVHIAAVFISFISI